MTKVYLDHSAAAPILPEVKGSNDAVFGYGFRQSFIFA